MITWSRKKQKKEIKDFFVFNENEGATYPNSGYNESSAKRANQRAQRQYTN